MGAILALACTQAKADIAPGKVLLGNDTASQITSQSDLSKFKPAERILKTMKRVRTPSLEAPMKAGTPAPSVVPGAVGGQAVANTAPAPVDDGFAPQNYGSGGVGNINHYSDNLVPLNVTPTFPYRTVGWFTFIAYDNNSYRCSATLISKSILLIAGHCIHDGGGGSPYYIKSGTFYPAYANGTQPYGYATANYVITTSGWYNTGSLDQGYDVGLVVLNKRAGTTVEMGNYTGWLGFCYLNCLQSYWQLTQLGYPGNYYSGQYMTMGQHIEYSDSKDYRAGSGMQGGSSGGPHIANLGDLSDSSTSKGSYPWRNIAFAATSWGYIDQAVKIQGYSSTSGPANANNFKGLYNAACTRARTIHGTGSCNLLP
ncbi:trypsin-like serine peptidase [Aestuariivirga litoralis]|uniref:trypsin-like serine peptidase n=1 Tax=Aestuariivirga litoralis TaxID=2650924 RepID=UPI00137B7399|nr:trypsin-like serine protease [Aestuariivirga litoralis]